MFYCHACNETSAIIPCSHCSSDFLEEMAGSSPQEFHAELHHHGDFEGEPLEAMFMNLIGQFNVEIRRDASRGPSASSGGQPTGSVQPTGRTAARSSRVRPVQQSSSSANRSTSTGTNTSTQQSNSNTPLYIPQSLQTQSSGSSSISQQSHATGSSSASASASASTERPIAVPRSRLSRQTRVAEAGETERDTRRRFRAEQRDAIADIENAARRAQDVREGFSRRTQGRHRPPNLARPSRAAQSQPEIVIGILDLLTTTGQMMRQLMGMLGAPHDGDLGDYVMGDGRLEAVLTRLMEVHERDNRPPAATPETISGLLRENYTAETAKKDCPVCQDDYTEDVEIMTLPCKHTFHPDCILNWLRLNGTCPVCRYSLVDNPIIPSMPALEPIDCDDPSDDDGMPSLEVIYPPGHEESDDDNIELPVLLEGRTSSRSSGSAPAVNAQPTSSSAQPTRTSSRNSRRNQAEAVPVSQAADIPISSMGSSWRNRSKRKERKDDGNLEDNLDVD